MVQLMRSYPGYTSQAEVSNSGHARRVFALRYFPNQRHVFATGGWDNCVKVSFPRFNRENNFTGITCSIEL